MKFSRTYSTALLMLLLLLAQPSVFAQETAPQNSAPQQSGPLGLSELPDTKEVRRFVEENSFDNPSFRLKQAELSTSETPPAVQGSKQVRIIYLVPSDKSPRADYQSAIANAITNLQPFFKGQMPGGYTFSMHSPAVEVYQTSHPSAFYSTGTNAQAGGYWASVLGDGFALTGGGFNDPNNRWIFYMDADPGCSQYTGGTSGVALLPANDLRGLTDQYTVPVCSSQHPELINVGRWIGGLGHELGHALNLPHPPGCDGGNCTGGQFAYLSLMYFGYYYYPNTYLLDADRQILLSGGFFNVLTLDPLARRIISGRVTGPGGASLSGATLTVSETQASVTSDAGGNFSFTDLPSGGNYTVSVSKAGYSFTPQGGVLFNNLDRDQVVNFAGTPLISQLQFSASTYQVGEAQGYATITVSRSGDTNVPATVRYASSDSTDVNFRCNPATSGQPTGIASRKCDYHIASGRLRFAPGETSKRITLSITNDAYVEGPETFTLTLWDQTGATAGAPGTTTITINDDDAPGASNPIDGTSFYVRQLYVDLLSREPDQAGWDGWTSRIDLCGQPGQAPPPCDRVTVGGDGFLRSSEFFDRQFFVLRLYKTAFGRILQYSEVGDLAYVSGFLSPADLELNKQELVADIISRSEFTNRYGGLTNAAFVDTLLQTAGVTVSQQSRDAWVAALGSGASRAQIFREVSDSPEVSARHLTEAQVVSAYYGFFTRNPDGAYFNYLDRLNRGEINLGDLANAFINAAEYRQRFGQ